MWKMKMIVIASCLFLLWTANAYAYLGPGLGAGTIAIVLGTMVSLFLVLFSVLYYPIKRFFKNRKNGSKQP